MSDNSVVFQPKKSFDLLLIILVYAVNIVFLFQPVIAPWNVIFKCIAALEIISVPLLLRNWYALSYKLTGNLLVLKKWPSKKVINIEKISKIEYSSTAAGKEISTYSFVSSVFITSHSMVLIWFYENGTEVSASICPKDPKQFLAVMKERCPNAAFKVTTD